MKEPVPRKKQFTSNDEIELVIWTVINYFILSFLKIIIVLKLGGNDRYAIYARNIVTRFCYCLRFDTSLSSAFFIHLCVTLRGEHMSLFYNTYFSRSCRQIIYFIDQGQMDLQ